MRQLRQRIAARLSRGLSVTRRLKRQGLTVGDGRRGGREQLSAITYTSIASKGLSSATVSICVLVAVVAIAQRRTAMSKSNSTLWSLLDDSLSVPGTGRVIERGEWWDNAEHEHYDYLVTIEIEAIRHASL